MDEDQVNTIRATMESRTTKDLSKIYQENNRSEYTDEAFEAVRQILEDREEDRGEIPEQSNLSNTQPRQEPTTHQASPGTQVIVTDIRMQFGSMVVFMVKWAIASIPAMIILFLAGVAILGLLGGFVGIVK